MEKSAFERHIEARFAAQEAVPNPQLWDRLEASLSKVSEEKTPQKSPRLWRFSVAASLLGVAIGVFFMQQRSGSGQQIDTATFELVVSPEQKEAAPNEAQLLVKKASLDKEIDGGVNPKDAALKSESLAFSKPTKTAAETEILPLVNLQSDKNSRLSAATATARENAIESSEAMATVLLEAHISNAQTHTQQLIEYSIAQNLSGSDLLLEVESDLNKSFRAKVVQEIKQNIVKVGQAMAVRNQ